MFARTVLTRAVPRLAITAAPRVALPRATRQFSLTARRYATPEEPDAPSASDMQRIMSDPAMRGMVEKLGQHPTVMAAMQKLSEVMRSKGFGPGNLPGKMDMMKLAFDQDFRQAAETLNEELQKADIQLDPEIMKKVFSP
jgi:hypothetical protein